MATNTTQETALDLLVDSLVNCGAERELVTREATFEELDVDSLDLAELAQIIEERFAVKIAASDVKEISTVGDLVELIVDRA